VGRIFQPERQELRKPLGRTYIDRMEAIEQFPPSFGETVAAGFRRQNIFSAIPEFLAMEEIDKTDEGFDPFDGDYLKGYERYAPSFSTVFNKAHGDQVKAQIDRQLMDSELLAGAGGTGTFAEMLGAITSPTALVPILGQARYPHMVGRFFQGATRGGALIGAEELVLQATQPTRTAEETFLGVGASAMVSGIIGSFLRPKRPPEITSQPLIDDMSGTSTFRATAEPPRSDEAADTVDTKFNEFMGEVREAELAAAKVMDNPPNATPARELSEAEQSAFQGMRSSLDEILQDIPADMEVRGVTLKKEMGEIEELLGSVDIVDRMTGIRQLTDLMNSSEVQAILDRSDSQAVASLRASFENSELPFIRKMLALRDGDQRPRLTSEEWDAQQTFSGALRSNLEITGHDMIQFAKGPGGAFIREIAASIGPSLRRDVDLLEANLEQLEVQLRATELAGDMSSPGVERALLQKEATEGAQRYYPAAKRLKEVSDIYRENPKDPVTQARILEVLRSERAALTKIEDAEISPKAEKIINRLMKKLSEAELKIFQNAEDMMQTGRIMAEDGRIVDPNALPPAPKSAGAAAAEGRPDALTLRQEFDNLTMIPALGLEKIPDGPGKRLLNSSEIASRRLVLELVETPYFLKGHQRDFTNPTSVESLMKLHWWPTAEAILEMNRLYDVYRGGVGDVRLRASGRRMFEDALRGRDGAMSQQEFQQEVGKALHSGDTHPIEEVAEAARFIRKKVFEPLKKELMDEEVFVSSMKRDIRRLEDSLQGLKNSSQIKKIKATILRIQTEIDEFQKVGPQHTNAESFAPVFYRLDKIQDNYDAFKQILREHYRSNGLKGEDLEIQVTATVQKIERQKPYIKIDDDAVGTARSLRERRLDVPVNKLFDYLELDAEAMLRYYTRTVSADLELTRRFGDHTLKDQIDEISANYDARIDAVGQSGKSAFIPKVGPKDVVALRRALLNGKRQDIRDVRAIRDRHRGTYGLPEDPFRNLSRFYRGAKQFQYLTMLGGVTISSIPDIARIIMTEGTERAFRDAFMPFIKGLDNLKLSAKDSHRTGAALELILGFRMQQFTELGDTFGRHSKIERGLMSSSSVFSLVNLFNPWNATMKQLAGATIGSRIIEDSIVTGVRFRNSLGTKVVKRTDSDPIMSGGKNPRRLTAKYNRRSNIMELDEAEVLRTYEAEAWHNSPIAGVGDLPDDFIRNVEDWRDFVVNHELAHADYPRMKGEEKFEYENRMNQVAINRVMIKRLGRAGGVDIQPKTMGSAKSDEAVEGSPQLGYRNVDEALASVSEMTGTKPGVIDEAMIDFMRTSDPQTVLTYNAVVAGALRMIASLSAFDRVARGLKSGDLLVPALNQIRRDFDDYLYTKVFKKNADDGVDVIVDVKKVSLEEARTLLDEQEIALRKAIGGLSGLKSDGAKRAVDQLEIFANEVKKGRKAADDPATQKKQKDRAQATVEHFDDIVSGRLGPEEAVTQADRLHAAFTQKTGELSPFGKEKLRRGGISDEMADRITKQWEQHGFIEDGLIIANTDAWDDIAAKETFRTALSADIDRAIVTPGVGDRPLWMSTELGSVIGQFKAFSVASAQRVLIPGIQQRDGQVLMGLTAMIALGVMVDEIKRQQFGIKTGGSLTERIQNGIDRSGVTGYFNDVNRAIERVSDNRIGISSILGTEPPYRPSFRSKAGTILGPTAGQGLRVGEVISDTLSGEYDYRTAGALRRLIPGQNVLWLKPAYDLIEEGLTPGSDK
jgi:hypothetical protein